MSSYGFHRPKKRRRRKKKKKKILDIDDKSLVRGLYELSRVDADNAIAEGRRICDFAGTAKIKELEKFCSCPIHQSSRRNTYKYLRFSDTGLPNSILKNIVTFLPEDPQAHNAGLDLAGLYFRWQSRSKKRNSTHIEGSIDAELHLGLNGEFLYSATLTPPKQWQLPAHRAELMSVDPVKDNTMSNRSMTRDFKATTQFSSSGDVIASDLQLSLALGLTDISSIGTNNDVSEGKKHLKLPHLVVSNHKITGSLTSRGSPSTNSKQRYEKSYRSGSMTHRGSVSHDSKGQQGLRFPRIIENSSGSTTENRGRNAGKRGSLSFGSPEIDKKDSENKTSDSDGTRDLTGGVSVERIKGKWFKVGQVCTLLFEYYQWFPAGQRTHKDLSLQGRNMLWQQYPQYIFHDWIAERSPFGGLPCLRNAPRIGDRSQRHYRFNGPYYLHNARNQDGPSRQSQVVRSLYPLHISITNQIVTFDYQGVHEQ